AGLRAIRPAVGPAGWGPARPPPQTPGALRLVSTAPNLTEIVFAIGAGGCLVGRTDVCDYPPEAAQVPAVGGFASPWLEPLLATRPTHVLECAMEDAALRKHLGALGIPLVHIPCSRLDDIPDAILQLGKLTDNVPLATVFAHTIRAALKGNATSNAVRPSVFLLLAPESPITAGADTFVSELLELAGGGNAAVGAGGTGYFHASLEWLLTRDPDIILCLFDTRDGDPAARFASRTGWQSLRAVREGRVKTVADLDTVLRPGPRVLQGLAQLRECLGEN
ncbi:MAG: helical backbone metal receptor, partial [Kiritimatiellaeota bacterium]|nr:helical backbone metal receptor [Kiritimatiellota bacterium]